MIVDGLMMYVGSANFYLDIMNPEKNNLNVGIITNQQHAISYVGSFFAKDWDLHQAYELHQVGY